MVWRTIRSYIWWTHERGSLHYDLMVTAILAFIFLTPARLFHDRPASPVSHLNEIVVSSDGGGTFDAQVDAAAVNSENDTAIRTSLAKAVEPVAGAVEILDYQAIRSSNGELTAYRAKMRRR